MRNEAEDVLRDMKTTGVMKNSKFKIKNRYDIALTFGHPDPEHSGEGPAKADFSSYALIKSKVIPVQTGI